MHKWHKWAGRAKVSDFAHFGALIFRQNNRAISGQNSRRIFGQNNRGNKRRKTPITNIKNVSKNVIFQTRYMAKV
jgi:hypothetical protein